MGEGRTRRGNDGTYARTGWSSRSAIYSKRADHVGRGARLMTLKEFVKAHRTEIDEEYDKLRLHTMIKCGYQGDNDRARMVRTHSKLYLKAVQAGVSM